MSIATRSSPSVRLLAALPLLAVALPARAERQRPAFDPRLHIRPPTMKAVGGGSAELVYDVDFEVAAARWRASHPGPVAADGAVTVSGEVVVVQGDDQIATFDGGGYGLNDDALAVVARRAIQAVGDNFQAITTWLTFDDRRSSAAEAYEMPVKNEVEGLGRLPIRDASAAFGSQGVLRSMLNMKTVGLRAGDTKESWTGALETWGQESAHRWMVFMLFRDPRNGRISDWLLGRDCAHYSRYVDTQASVHDGLAWQDNGNGTFTWTEANKRYGDLDLYGMGLMAADEVPPFFLIDDIPGYKYPATCRDYGALVRYPERTVSGTRVDITIDDVIAANGERRVPSRERQDYWREAEVIVTAPNETAQSPRVVALAARINKARLYWEQWNREASRNRLVMCTQLSADCGDPRSDVAGVAFNTAGKAPGSGPLAVDVQITNPGGRQVSAAKATIQVTVGGQGDVRTDSKDVGTLDPGATRTVSFPLDLRSVPCGTQIAVKASTQSDYHFHRGSGSFLVGTSDRFSDGFEADSGWTIDPDGDDSTLGAQWERGRPEATSLFQSSVQPGAAHGGGDAWVTGLSAAGTSTRSSLVREGKATLQSPLYDTDGLRDPLLRYWVSFAGVRTDGTGQSFEPSPQSSLVVQARSVDMSAAGAATPGEWVDIDTIDNSVAPDWTQRTAALPRAVTGKNRLQLRFVATDANPEQGGVEAAIDDITITTNLPACYLPPAPPAGAQSGGGGCTVGGRASPPLLVLLGLGLGLPLARRRRR
jgi:hypothetical protein